MDKMRMESVDLTAQNIDKIGALFPNCITETVGEDGKPKKAINFDVLRQMLSGDVVDGDEAYEFTWVGKKAAIVDANRPIRKTLRPCKAESVDWDNTENLYIEGDNLDVLKLLQESYLGSIKMIYIDPPYNTGNDIIYKNDFYIDEEEYEENITIDTEGNRLFTNYDTNGRFHSDWCSMMYSRVKLARNLLTEDGFFAVAIDHNELFNIGSICDETFGFENRIAIISVIHKPEGRNQAKFIGPSNEYMIIYAKNSKVAKMQNVVLDPEVGAKFNLHDEKGNYRLQNFIRMTDGKLAYRDVRPKFWYPIYVNKEYNKLSISKTAECNVEVYPITKVGVEMSWKVLPNTAQELINNGELEIDVSKDGFITIMEKIRATQVIKTHWIRKEYNAIQYGTKIVNELLGAKIFDFPKSVYLMQDIYKLFTSNDDIILDFFSGSATSAHAINLLNAEDGGNRKYIMVQIPAATDENGDAYKSGYKTICEIGKERIRRAGVKIKEKNPGDSSNLDLGFRVLKLSDSNMNDVYYNPDDYSQGMLSMLESNVKTDRTDLDLLFGCLLEWGLPLSLPYSSENIEGCTVHNYNDGDLIACFDENVPDSVIKKIAKKQPLRAVFRDSSFANSPSKINVGEIFKLIAPDTRVKVI